MRYRRCCGALVSFPLGSLKIFGGSSVGGGSGANPTAPESKAQLHLNYRPSSACLNLCLVEGHSVTECEIHTLDIEAPHRVRLSLAEGERVPARIVVASDVLKSGKRGAPLGRAILLHATLPAFGHPHG